MLRLQGFPDAYKIVCGYAAMRKLTGNSVAVPAVEAVIRSVLNSVEFKKEFPQAAEIVNFLEERNYLAIPSPDLWQIDLVRNLQ